MGIILTLMGCANQQTFLKGKALLNEGKVTEGMTQLQLAMEQDPANIEYKTYFYRQRETWVAKLLREAETDKINSDWENAQKKYANVLEIDPKNQRASDGIKSVDSAKTNQERLDEANEFFKAYDYEGARQKLKLILIEEPANAKARSLNSKVEQKIASLNTPAAKVNSKFKRMVTLELRDTNIKTAFELISKAAGINFILDKDIRSDTKVSIFVKNTSIENALKNIFSSQQLSKKVLNENSVLIYPNSKKSDYEENIVRTFYLNNVDAKQAQTLIKTIVKTKDIFIDDQLNILVMKDTPEAVQLAEKVIASYDIGDPEVLLEVEVLEVSTDKLTELGVRWPNQITAGIAGAGGNGQLTLDEAKHFNSGFGRLTITDPALILNLRGTAGESNLLANPHIRVKNHKKARVHIGDRVPVITNTSTSTGFVAESVSYLDVGLKLNVEPSITIEDEVSIDIGLEVSNIVSEVTSKNGTLTYRLGTRNADTTLRLKNGETQILAGLISDDERSSSERVPGVASIPIIGRLFSSNKDTHTKTEIVLLITPKIIRNILPPDYNQSEFSSGTESGNSSPGMPGGDNATDLNSAGNSSQPVNSAVPLFGESQPESSRPLMPEPLNIPPPPPLPVQPAQQQPVSP